MFKEGLSFVDRITSKSSSFDYDLAIMNGFFKLSLCVDCLGIGQCLSLHGLVISVIMLLELYISG